MAKSGDQNPQTREIVPFFGAERRLRPPETLPDAARRAFIDLVASLPASHFRASDASLLCTYAELCALRERAAFELERCAVTPDGKPSPWLTIYMQSVKSITALAPKLRLGPQSRQKVSKREPAPVNYYDRARMDDKEWDKFPP
jgi:phage terminase small subunit